jgi:hypothetical protein
MPLIILQLKMCSTYLEDSNENYKKSSCLSALPFLSVRLCVCNNTTTIERMFVIFDVGRGSPTCIAPVQLYLK